MVDKWIPNEKKHKITGATVESNAIIDFKEKIEGVNTDRGVSMTGGTIEQYIQILEVYYENAEQKIEQINKALNANDISLYTTYVHAIKSASKSIGADGVSRLAAALEEAGHRKEFDYIHEHTENLLYELKELAKNIKPVVDKYKKLIRSAVKASMKRATDAQPPNDLLKKLKDSLQVYDVSSINRYADDLKDYSNEQIEKLLRNIITGEYDEAELLIDEMIKT